MDNTEFSTKIQIDLVKLLYRQIPIGLWAESLAAISLAWVQWNLINSVVLTTWLITNLLFCGLCRHLLVYFYKRTEARVGITDQNYQLWLNLFMIGALISGISWGFVGSSLLNVPGNLVHQRFTALLLVGVTAAANPLYSPNRQTYALFLTTAFVPFAIFLMMEGGIYVILGVLAFIYIAVMLATSLYTYQLIFSSLRLRYENINLVNHLSATKSDLENRTNELEKSLQTHKTLEEKLFHQANFDLLTNLPNRGLAHDRLSQVIRHLHHTHLSMAVLFIDIDRFKSVNDTMGHLVGDKLLIAVAHRLLECVRSGDTVARVGGDEFIVVLTPVNNDDVIGIVSKCIECIQKPFKINGKIINTSISIGVSFYPKDGREAELLIRNADIAMYRAKEFGRNNFQFFTKEMNKRLLMRMAMENQLRMALEKNEFMLVYQPIINLKSKKISGIEVLLRWHHPKLGVVSPTDFIPIAEESGIIVAIGEWVIRNACKQALMWQQEGIQPINISVNLSAKQIAQLNIYERIEAILSETKFNPHYLSLELTESILMQDMERNIETLTYLKELGIRLVIDDFGVGYSSLNYLKRLPVDKLKIDKSFVDDVPLLPDAAAIISAIIALAASLNLRVIAEGVENLQQLRFLIHHHCDEIQGFYFSEPMDEEACTKLLREQKEFELPM